MEATCTPAIFSIEEREATEPSDSTGHLQSSLLSELPGAAYGLITIAWIVSSFFSL
jgi:hypothetical protein